MDICSAGRDDISQLAHLLWLDSAPHEQSRQSFESFAGDLHAWWTDHADTHVPFVARNADTEVVGMAWLALMPRLPRPGASVRLSADIQTVFVLPEVRGQGIGSALVQKATDHALGLGALRVTVHSGRRAVPVYERLGFASSPRLLMRAGE